MTTQTVMIPSPQAEEAPPALPEGPPTPPKRLSAAKRAANRANASQGGVKTPEGKAVSRHNARRHGIFASALTDADAEDLADVHDRFSEDLEPATAIEEALVEKIALCYLRLQRCARAEAVHYRATWFPHRKDEGFFGPGDIVGGMRPWYYETVATVLGRYDTSLTNQLLRLMHELERVQRTRKGEAVPPPATADLTMSGD